MMDKREWIAIECEWENGEGNPDLAVRIVTETWDGMTPMQRLAQIMAYIDNWYNCNDHLQSIRLVGAKQGKFYLIYPTHAGIDLTVREMLDAEVLDFEWISKGYEDKAEMHENEDEDESEPRMLIHTYCTYQSQGTKKFSLPVDIAQWDGLTPEARSQMFLHCAAHFSMSRGLGEPENIFIRNQNNGSVAPITGGIVRNAAEMVAFGVAENA
jgi:hypothetical protein